MYVAVYAPEFRDQLARYPQLKKKVENAKNRILQDPRYRTELLKKKGRYDLAGLRSTHVGDGQFVIVFAICEEYLKKFPADDPISLACQKSEGNAVIFLTFGPHDQAYRFSGRF